MIKMTRSIIAFVLIGIALVCAPFIAGKQGYTLIAFGPYTIEGSFFEFGISLIVLAVGIWLIAFLVRLLYATVILPSKWWQNRQQTVQGNFLQAGIDYMILAQWQQAINQFTKVVHPDRVTAAKKLMEVCYAQLQPEQNLIASATTKPTKYTSVFAHVSQLLQAQDYASAKTLLDQSNINIAKQPLPFQQLALAVSAHNFNWNDVAVRLPKLIKLAKKHADAAAISELQQQNTQLLCRAFNDYVNQHSVNQLAAVWNGWHKALQNLPEVKSAYVLTMVRHQHFNLVEAILSASQLPNDAMWLLSILREANLMSPFVPVDSLFSKVQSAVNKSPDDKTLITVFAYLAAGQKDYGLAKQAFEQVIFSNNDRRDNRIYALVLAELGEVRQSVEVFKSIGLMQ